METAETCRGCGGDGQDLIKGVLVMCQMCRGTGRRPDMSAWGTNPTASTKTGARYANVKKEKRTEPETPEGISLARTIRDSMSHSAEAKARLIQEIVSHEDTHARLTETFRKKIAKQLKVIQTK